MVGGMDGGRDGWIDGRIGGCWSSVASTSIQQNARNLRIFVGL